MGTIRDSRFHRATPPATAGQHLPAPGGAEAERRKDEDFSDITDLSKLPRVWG